nr:carbon-nitrogen hydrolase family protein [Sphingobium nicotianae]
MTIAAVQCAALFDDVAATSAHILARAREATKAGARLIVFPEAYLTGHSYNAALVAKRAMPIDDPAILTLAEALAALPVVAIVGFFERRGDLIHNSAMVIADGRVVGTYAKIDPREAGCTPGTQRPVFACEDWPFAISICRDTRSSELALDLAARGARLLVYPLGNMLPPEAAEVNRDLTATGHIDRARETGCWVVSADVVGTQGDWVAHGNTRVITPDGEIVADVPAGETGMIVRTIG